MVSGCQTLVDSGFLELFRVLKARIPDSISKIFRGSGFHEQKFQSEIQIPLHGTKSSFVSLKQLCPLLTFCSSKKNLKRKSMKSFIITVDHRSVFSARNFERFEGRVFSLLVSGSFKIVRNAPSKVKGDNLPQVR